MFSARFPSLKLVAVALHPEGVDRNTATGAQPIPALVALHPEGVDRNITCRSFYN